MKVPCAKCGKEAQEYCQARDLNYCVECHAIQDCMCVYEPAYDWSYYAAASGGGI